MLFLLRQYIFFFLFSLSANVVSAQLSFSFRHYDVEDGLPSTNLYDIVQDDKGFIWIASEAGVCRYDGKTFEKEPIKKLGNAEVINLFVDSRNQLWLIDLANNISVLNGDSLIRLSQHPDFEGKQFTEVAEDRRGNYWLFGTLENEVAFLNGNALLDSIDIYYKNDIFSSFKLFYPFNDSLQIIITDKGVAQFRDLKLETKSFQKKLADHGPFSSVQINDTILFSTQERLYEFSRWKLGLDPVFTEFNELFAGGITKLFKDVDNNLWVGTKDGLLYFPKGDRKNPKQFLSGQFISGIIQDHEGGYWFSTQKDGLYYLPSLNIQIFQNRSLVNHLTTVCPNSNNEVIIGYDHAYINVLDSNYILKKQWRIVRGSNEIYDVVQDEIRQYYILHSRMLQVLDEDFDLKKQKIISMKIGTSIRPNEIYFGAATKAGKYLVESDSFKIFLEERTYSILPTLKDTVWIGTTKGLYLFSNNEATLVKEPLLQQDIRDIKQANDGTLWVATQGDGVILYKNNEVVNHLTTATGLVSNNCKRILFDGSQVWIGTNKGIQKITLNDFNFNIITMDNGLPSNEINDLQKKDDDILVATNGGLAVFNDSLEVFASPPLLQFTKISFNEVDTDLKDQYQVSHREDNVSIEFSGIAFQQSDDIEFQYQLSPRNDTWVPTRANVAQFQSLKHGNYTFKVRARTINSSWSPEKTIQFTIATPFWKRQWFLILVVATGLFLLYKIFAWIWDDIRDRKEIQAKLKASQMTALRAQMDPHFLFNSLNSIQEFIMLQDKREANRYLSRFSKLMRNILNMSDMEEVKLNQEIEALELYLSLEALRFEENFDYYFEIDNNIDTGSLTIPPMLVQPYVENAVKHGLMHKKNGSRKLWIRFNLKDDMLVCEIEDNGVGRKKTREIQKRDKKIYASRGMKLTKERLKLLNDAYDNQLSVDIEDLIDEQGNALGTKVMLYISLD